jgi:hypothetical protein
MSRKKPSPGMIGEPPSARGGRPADPGLHAQQIAREWEDVAEGWVRRRMKELGIPDDQIGERGASGERRAFDSSGRQGGANSTGVMVDSGVLNPELLKGKKGGRIYPKLSARDRADAIIAHEYEELRHGSHAEALKAAVKTDLPISDGARRLCRAMARSSARLSHPG